MSMAPFVFDPPTGWNDPVVFPTLESSEIKVRSDMQKLHDQTRDFINDLVDEVNQGELRVSTTVNSTPKTIYSTKITANHTLLRVEIGTPANVVGEWSATFADGSLTLDGTLSGSTTMVLVIGKPAATI